VRGPIFAGAGRRPAWPTSEKSLQLSPASPHALDTRAHIRQALGDPQGALNDYDKAMWHGGARMIKLYQCGLTEARLYTGEIDGALAAGADAGARAVRARQGLRSAPGRRAVPGRDELSVTLQLLG
jgi:hypothetical protein